MPTYEYVCTACQNAWEEVQKISENAIQVCPKCGQSTAKRQISGGNFILKGGGLYADLYSSTKKSSGDSKDAKSESKSEGASSSESKSSESKSSESKSSESKSSEGGAAKSSPPAAKPSGDSK